MRALGAACGLMVVAGCGRIGFDPFDRDSGAEPSDAPASADAPGPDGGIPSSAAHRGEVLVVETFDDEAFAARGWYDSPAGAIDVAIAAPGSTSSLRCEIAAGTSVCTAGAPARRAFAATSSLYTSHWVRYGPDSVHTTTFFLLTDLDPPFIGPGISRLTVDVEGRALAVRVAMLDNANIDQSCYRRSDGTTVGCGGGAFEAYPFTEMRSVCACNGLAGTVEGWSCTGSGGDLSSTRWWESSPAYDAERWHFVETYFRMSTIEGGIGQADGIIRAWVDGRLVVSIDRVLFRTGAHPSMAFAQILLNPYVLSPIGVAQTLWVDDHTIARGAF
jgi:hypothetical protein